MTDIKTTVNNISEAEIEILCEVDVETFEKERTQALERIGKEVTLPGFRKGHVPSNVLEQKFGEAFILEEMANLTMEKVYPEILRKHKVSAIAQPTVQVKKLAKDNPFEFSLTFQVLPEIKLPDYKKIAQGVMSDTDDTVVTEEDVEKALTELRKQYATKDDKGKEMLPELNDELAQKFGPFANVAEFTEKVRESLAHEKQTRAREKKRMQTMEKIADGITVTLPTLLIDGELDRMMFRFRQDIERMGMKLEAYLSTIKKTEEDFRKEWRVDAEKRVKIQIALGKIAVAEKLEVPKDELDREVKFLTEQHKDIDPARAYEHLEMMLLNEKVFQFLEQTK